MIRLENVSQYFGKQAAISSLSLQLESGQVTALLGPNGAGKTTTMRLITGYLTPDEGRVLIDGQENIHCNANLRARIGYLPENNPLYEDLTVLEHLHMAAGIRGLSGHRQREAVVHAANRCDLRCKPSLRVGELSKGFRQRLGLAQALLGDPDILVLDEPATGLDPLQAQHMSQLIAELAQERTLLLSSHLLDQTLHQASTVIVLREGLMAFEGSPQAFRQCLKPQKFKLVIRANLSQVQQRLSALSPEAIKLVKESQGYSHFEVKGDASPTGLEAVFSAMQGLPVSALAPVQVPVEDCFAHLMEAPS